VLVYQPFELTLVPAHKGLFPVNNEGGVFPNPMAEALDHPNWRVSIDDFYHKAVFIKATQFSDPVGKSITLFLQVLRIIIQRFLVELFLQTGLLKEDGTVAAMTIGRHGPCNDLKKNGFHGVPFLKNQCNKEKLTHSSIKFQNQPLPSFSPMETVW
jgi:hypothetical protein